MKYNNNKKYLLCVDLNLFLWLYMCLTWKWGVAWDLREMGSAQGKGVREGQSPQAGREISIQLPARKEATWSRKRKEGQVRRDEEDLACKEWAYSRRLFNNVIRCNIDDVKINVAFVSRE
jgi:hypothetical protein